MRRMVRGLVVAGAVVGAVVAGGGVAAAVTEGQCTGAGGVVILLDGGTYWCIGGFYDELEVLFVRPLR